MSFTYKTVVWELPYFSIHLNGRGHWLNNWYQDQMWDDGEGELIIQKYKCLNNYICDINKVSQVLSKLAKMQAICYASTERLLSSSITKPQRHN
jgi:hypothetical protein